MGIESRIKGRISKLKKFTGSVNIGHAWTIPSANELAQSEIKFLNGLLKHPNV